MSADYSNSLSGPRCQRCFLHFITHSSVRLSVWSYMHSLNLLNEECMCNKQCVWGHPGGPAVWSHVITSSSLWFHSGHLLHLYCFLSILYLYQQRQNSKGTSFKRVLWATLGMLKCNCCFRSILCAVKSLKETLHVWFTYTVSHLFIYFAALAEGQGSSLLLSVHFLEYCMKPICLNLLLSQL